VVGITQLRGRDGPLDTVLARLAQPTVRYRVGRRHRRRRRVRQDAPADGGVRRRIRTRHPVRPWQWPIRWIAWSNSPRCSKRLRRRSPLFDRDRLSDQHAAPQQRSGCFGTGGVVAASRDRGSPYCCCLDDLHWADNGTAAALRVLAESGWPACRSRGCSALVPARGRPRSLRYWPISSRTGRRRSFSTC